MSNERENEPKLTQLQQKAILVCAACALALIVTISVTTVLVTKQIRAANTNPGSQSSSQGGHSIDSGAVLAETEDAGEEYVKETLFIGDSNTLRLYNNGMITLQQYCAREGLTTKQASDLEFVSFKRDAQPYKISDAVAKMKPRRVLITLGTNDAASGVSAQDFIASYRTLLENIQSSYAYTDIIVNAVPAIPQNHSKVPTIDQDTINDYNDGLAALCEEMELKFLNSSEAIMDDAGFGQAGYYSADDVHLTLSGLTAMLDYYRTHSYSTEDRRPDVKSVAQRAEDFVIDPNQPTADPTAKPTEEPEAEFTASYHVQPANTGTLSTKNVTGKTSLKMDIQNPKESITVTAVPNPGHVFVKWSDGKTSPTRTDKNFKQNLDVTATFVSLNLEIGHEAKEVAVGDEVKISAKLSRDKYAKIDDVVWYLNKEKVNGASGGTYSFKPEKAGKLEVYAEVTYNGQTLRSNTITIDVAEVKPTATPTATPTPTPENTPEAVETPEPVAPENEQPAPPEFPVPPAEGGEAAPAQ